MKFYKISSKETKGWRRLGRTIGALPILIIAYNLLFTLLLQADDVRFEDIRTIVILLGSSVLLYFITWIFEVVGGLLLIINSTALIIYLMFLSPAMKSNGNAIALYAIPFIICGVIGIYCSWKDRNSLNNGNNSNSDIVPSLDK